MKLIKCPKCGSNQSIVKYKSKDYLYGIEGNFFVSKCLDCGLYYQNPAINNTEMGYPKAYAPHSKIEHHVPRHGFIIDFARKIKNWILNDKQINLKPDFVDNGKVLEIGCANGSRLLELKLNGWSEIHGIELINHAADEAIQSGINVKYGRVEDNIEKYPDEYFDVIIASMVLEHLENPFITFKKIARKLKPGGKILFSTLTRDSLDWYIYGRYWVAYDLPRHTVYFSDDDILDMIGTGFECVHSYNQYAAIDYIRSSTWRINDGVGTLFDKMIVKLGTKSLYVPLILLGKIGYTCRVSYSCTKRKYINTNKTYSSIR